MSTYLLLDISIILLPVLFSFERRVRYYSKFPSLFISILIIGTLYVLWDIMAHSRGDWAFNEVYLLGSRLLGIPLEEILFFIVVPYSCLFIYEVLNVFIKDHQFPIPQSAFAIAGLVCLGLSLLNYTRPYTRTVLAVCFLVLYMYLAIMPNVLRSKKFWLFIAITYFPFLIYNSILTALPVVTYNPKAIWGVRIGTIPIEDFLHSFSMISFYFLVYHYFQVAPRKRVKVATSSFLRT